jgi:O-acetyl-ADP-ribose deacetylase (regulator of RNase III)
MKIQYITGDLFSTEHKHILHGCNSKGVMGSGVARIVRDRYPEAYEKYTLWCSKGFRLGSCLLVATNDKIIINAVTQQNYGKVSEQTGPTPVRYVSYDAIADIFAQLEQTIPGTTIAMPRIGAALGGGDWSVISAIIESSCKTIQPVVYSID